MDGPFTSYTDGIMDPGHLREMHEWIEKSAQGKCTLKWYTFSDREWYRKYAGRWIFTADNEGDHIWFSLLFSDKFKGIEIDQDEHMNMHVESANGSI